MKTLIAICAALALSACSGERNSQHEKEFGTFNSDPEKMPESRTLYSPGPVLLLRVEATESGYTVRPFRAMGAPTSTLNRGGDVVIKSLDASGKVLATVTVENPRLARTAGSQRPEIAVLPAGSFTVSLGKIDSIRNIEITVMSGPNAGFKQTLPVDPKELRPVPDNN